MNLQKDFYTIVWQGIFSNLQDLMLVSGYYSYLCDISIFNGCKGVSLCIFDNGLYIGQPADIQIHLSIFNKSAEAFFRIPKANNI